MDLFKKKIETMNNKMAIHIYQELNLKHKLSKPEQRQNHGYGEHFDGCQMGEGCGENGWRGEGIKKYEQNCHGYCKIQYRKWSSQRTYMHDPWT